MRVYKLMCERWALEALKNRRLRVSLFADLNDPFELRAITVSTEKHKTGIAGFGKSMHEQYAIHCFSRNWNDPLLWSHYADKHRGLCLGFDIPDKNAIPIVYSDAFIPVDWDKQLSAEKRDPNLGLKLSTTKYVRWKYEDEIRVMGPRSAYIQDGEHSFERFGDNLHLCEVVIGVRSVCQIETLRAAMQEEDETATIVTSQMADDCFRIVAKEVGLK